jgi:hypothetical protein
MNKLTDKDFNLIENFISGILSPEEEKKFRQRLKKDNKLLKEYNFRTKIKKYWNDAEKYSATKDEIKQVISFEKKKRNNRLVWSIAASIVILVGISILFYPQIKLNESNLADMTPDSVAQKGTPLYMGKQPEKGKLYTLPLTFTTKDTLLIQRKPDFPASGTVSLIEQENHKEIFEMDFSQRTDSILIPLSEIAPGDYRWKINGTSYSGSFRIQEDNSQQNGKMEIR